MTITTSEHFELVEEKLVQLLSALGTFSGAEKREIQEFIDVGEYGLATETAFQIVTEESKPISRNAYDLFQDLVKVMEIQGTVDLERLESHVE